MERWNGGDFFSHPFSLLVCLYSMAKFSVCLLLFQAILFFTQVFVLIVVCFLFQYKSRHSVDKNSRIRLKHSGMCFINSCMEVVVGAVF